MAACVADIGRDDETDRGAEETREAQAEEKVFPSSPTVGRVRFQCQGQKRRPRGTGDPPSPHDPLSASSI